MAKTHTLNKILTQSDGATIQDSGVTYTGDTVENSDLVVNANGGAANAIESAFTAANFKSAFLVSTVPCVVTFTGSTAIDGITTSTVTLAANVGRHIAAFTGDVTAISIGANTDSSGPAGTLKFSLLHNT